MAVSTVLVQQKLNTEERMYTVEDVQQHNHLEDAWMILCGRVLDVTQFIREHPGGGDVLLPYLGKDATIPYIDEAHSSTADALVRKYTIGMCSNPPIEIYQSTKAKQLCDALNPSLLTTLQEENHSKTATYELKQEGNSSQPPLENYDIIDFSKPLLSQVARLDRKTYFELIDKPNPTTKVLTIFPWPFVEAFSKTEWFIIPSVYGPIILFLLYYSVAVLKVSFMLVTILFLFGAFIWTFFEYLFHRFLFHCIETYLPNHWICISLHFLLHSVHHLLPMDPLRLVMPPALLGILISPFLTVSVKYLPSFIYTPGWGGVLFGYLCYDMIHYSTHHWTVANSVPHLRSMKTYHMKHHYKAPLRGFGVSSKLWDWVFQTLID